jgi:1-acyl-sn-glycerol-3-phosphate acyltransferase
MRKLVSFCLLSAIKIVSRIFYRIEVGWVGNEPSDRWDNIRLLVFLNHTSLFEPLFLGIVPYKFIWALAKKLVLPGADKTLNRPLVGRFFKVLTPNMIPVTRKKDHTWEQFLETIKPTSLVAILPEGRMMRKTGLDAEGKPMSVRGGVADILSQLSSGNLLIAYSGGLHHVQAPGDRFFRVFKTIKINFEQVPIAAYKEELGGGGNDVFKRAAINNLERRMKEYCP